jgi:protein O-mannosyl-transferase
MRADKYGPPSALACLLLVCWWAYQPGLSGGFLFDDYINLDALGRSGPVVDWPSLLRYLTSGSADPIGRPLSLLSFLMDARDWPADPEPFLRTNVLLHGLNGVLLYLLVLSLETAREPSKRTRHATALLATSCWLLHPLLVSTTLYVVQREAMLPATFTLAGLLGYIHGFSRYVRSQGNQGTLLMAGAIVLGSVLGALCKANGVLLPLLAWVLTATVLQTSRVGVLSPAAAHRLLRLQQLLLWLPSALLLCYLAQLLFQWAQIPDGRGWSIGQRLITQPRVLLHYLVLLLAPRSLSSGLYNDGYAVSMTLWNPTSTFPALLLVSALLVLATKKRHQHPRSSCAVLFFFAGHALESSVIPLELFFEHRNYVPSLLLFWPVSAAIVEWGRAPALRTFVAMALIATLSTITWQRSSLWGRPADLAAAWALRNPGSSRAQATWAASQVDAGRANAALMRLRPLWRQRPADLQLGLSTIDAACQAGDLREQDTDALAYTLRNTQVGAGLARQWLADKIMGGGTCIDEKIFWQWVAAAANTTTLRTTGSRMREANPLFGALELRRGDFDAALRYFNEAVRITGSPRDAVNYAGLLAAHGAYRQALAHLSTYEHTAIRNQRAAPGMPWLHSQVLARQAYWPRRVSALRTGIIDAMRTRTGQAPGALR